MYEYTGDFWQYPADVYIITTNGAVKKDGKAVMGAGIARQARDKYSGMDLVLGSLIKSKGNKPFVLGSITKDIPDEYAYLITLPVKHHWKQKADLKLIKNSLLLLEDEIKFVEANSGKFIETIVMVRPGCGNGGLEWSEVKPLCEKYLDNRYVIINKH